ncbi:hypothetical protein Asp14428_31290 [Actinoplanes sp. NBRC 14428]|nr:hypothetical protein Asp14428_31290 [Actinoplanes sp. NBRC 14428]
MSRPVRPQPAVPGPRMPESVLRRRPAEIVSRPRPAESPAAESGPNPAADPPVVTQAADARPPAVEGPPVDGRHAGSDARPPAVEGPPVDGRHAGSDARPTGNDARPDADAARPVAGRARPTAGGARSAPHAPSRSLLRAPRRSRVRAPAAVRARRPLPLGLMAVVLVFVGLFTVGAGFGAATGFDLGELFKGPDKPPPRDFPVLEPSRPRRLTIPAIKVEAPLLTVGLAKDDSVAVPR